MLRKLTVSCLLAATVGMVPAPAASPGVVFEMEITDHTQSPPTVLKTETAVEGLNVKMEMAPRGEGSRMTMIYHGDRHEMVMINHKDKSYSVLDEATLKEMAARMGAAMDRMNAAMAKMPKAQREAMQKMMKQKGMGAAMGVPPTAQSSRTELRKTDDTGTRAGYPCVKYEVLSDGRVIRELWVTDYKNIDGGEEVAAAMGSMAGFFQEMMDSFGEMSRGLGDRADNFMFEHMRELNGYPVVMRQFGADGSLKNETELKSSRRESLGPDQFEPPAGYKQQQMFKGR